MIPAFYVAMVDPALRGNARDVYIHLYSRLDVLEFRPVKHEALAIELRMERTTIAYCVNLLAQRGYLDRGPRDGRIRTYRLFHSRPLVVA